MAILEVKAIHKYFGGLRALQGFEMAVEPGEILGLIGPNGAGKTTLFNIITGFYRPDRGRVMFENEDITGLKPHQIAWKGISRTFQASTVFMESTVLENILTGFYLQHNRPEWKALRHTSSNSEEDISIREKAEELLEFTGLDTQIDKAGENLSSGYQKLLAIAVALTTSPRLLLLDEPITTLSASRVDMVMELITRVKDSGTTIVIIEHNMKAIMDYCDRIAVLAYGRNIHEGLPKDIRKNKEVVEAYLGEMG